MTLKIVKNPKLYVNLFNYRLVYRKYHFLRPNNTYLKLTYENRRSQQFQVIRNNSKLIAIDESNPVDSTYANKNTSVPATNSIESTSEAALNEKKNAPLIFSVNKLETLDQQNVEYEKKNAYFNKMSNLVNNLIDELQNAKLINHDYEKKSLDKTLSNLNQSEFVFKLLDNIRKKPETIELNEYLKNRNIYYDLTPKEKALLFRLNSIFQLIHKKNFITYLESSYFNENFIKKLDLNDHLNFMLGFWKSGKLQKTLLHKNSSIYLNYTYDLAKKAIIDQLRENNLNEKEATFQPVAETSASSNDENATTQTKSSQSKIDDTFSNIMHQDHLQAAYSLSAFIEPLYLEDVQMNFYKDLLTDKENLISKTNNLDLFLTTILLRINYRQRVKTFDYTVDNKIDNLIKERERFIFDNIDKIKNLNILKDFTDFYLRNFFIKWKLDDVTRGNLNNLKELFHKHFSLNLKKSHIQLESIRAEISIIENFKRLDEQVSYSNTDQTALKDHSSMISRSAENLIKEKSITTNNSKSFYTIKDRELINQAIDNGLNSIRVSEFIDLDRKYSFFETEFLNNERLCGVLDKTINDNMDLICDFRTVPSIVNVCSQLAKKNSYYFKTRLANTILYDAYHRSFSNKNYFYVKFNYLFNNLDFVTEKIELIKPHIPEWVKYNKLDFILKNLIDNKQAFIYLKKNHKNDYNLFLRSLLKRMNTEVKLTDYDIINYKIELTDSNEINMEKFDLNRLNKQILSKKTLKDLNDMINTYRKMELKNQDEPKNLSLDNRSFMIAFSNVIENSAKIYSHLKKHKLSMHSNRQQQQQNQQQQKQQHNDNSKHAVAASNKIGVEELKAYFASRFESVVEQLKIFASIYKLNLNQDQAKTIRFINYFNDLALIILDEDMSLLLNRQLINRMIIKMFSVTSIFNVYQLNESQLKSIDYVNFRNFNYHLFERIKNNLTLKYLININYTFMNASLFNRNAIQKLLSTNEQLSDFNAQTGDLTFNQKLFLINQKICIKYGHLMKCPFAFNHFNFDYNLLQLENSNELKLLHKYLKDLFGQDILKLDPTYSFNLKANFELSLDKYGNFLSPNDPNYTYKLPIIYLNKNMTYEDHTPVNSLSSSSSSSSSKNEKLQPLALYSNLINLLEAHHPVTIIKSAELNECKTDEEIYKYIKEKIINSIKKLVKVGKIF